MSGWYVAAEGRSDGPFDGDELERRRVEGQLGPDTLVWRDGFDRWTPASECELASLFANDGDNQPPAWGSAVHAPPPPPPGGAPAWQQQAPPQQGAWQPQPAARYQEPAFGWQQAPASQPTGDPSSAMSTAAIVCGVVSVLFFPIVLGPVGIVLAAVALGRKEPKAGLAMAIAVGGMVLGFIIGALMWGAL